MEEAREGDKASLGAAAGSVVAASRAGVADGRRARRALEASPQMPLPVRQALHSRRRFGSRYAHTPIPVSQKLSKFDTLAFL